MRRLLIPTLVVLVAAAQSVRVEVGAAEPEMHSGGVTQVYAGESEPESVSPPTPYVIEPPDILRITATGVVLKSSKRAQPFEGARIPVKGEHLVGADGRVNLGTYGTVYVTGMTIAEAKTAIEKKLSEKLEKPEVVVDVVATNSKRYYVITKGGDGVDSVVECPISGNDTVLDAIARVGGVSKLDSTKIWVARHAPNSVGGKKVLPVNFEEIVREGSDATNHQLQPGDRVFIERAASPEGDPQNARLPHPPKAVPATYEATPAYDATEALVQVEALVLEDETGALREFPDLRERSTMVADAGQFEATVRILRERDVLKRLSAPRLMILPGQEANVHVSGSNDSVDLSLVPSVRGEDISLAIARAVRGPRRDRDRQRPERRDRVYEDIRCMATVPEGSLLVHRVKSLHEPAVDTYVVLKPTRGPRPPAR